jgi:hypothetical protein
MDFEHIKQLPVDEKLNFIIENMSMMGLLKYRVDNLESTMYLNCAKHEVTDDRLKLLEYKQIDIEARSRQVNLIKTGVEETPGEDCRNITTDLLENHLNLDPSSFVILRALRIGRISRLSASQLAEGKPKIRNILVTFSQSIDVDTIMNSAYKLKNTGVGFPRDYPKEISEARKALWWEFKEARATYGSRNVQIVYPAALMVNKRIERNMFPDWFEVMQGSRHSNIPNRVSSTIKKNNELIKHAFNEHATCQSQPRNKSGNSVQMECINVESVPEDAILTQSKSLSTVKVRDHDLLNHPRSPQSVSRGKGNQSQLEATRISNPAGHQTSKKYTSSKITPNSSKSSSKQEKLYSHAVSDTLNKDSVMNKTESDYSDLNDSNPDFD